MRASAKRAEGDVLGRARLVLVGLRCAVDIRRIDYSCLCCLGFYFGFVWGSSASARSRRGEVCFLTFSPFCDIYVPHMCAYIFTVQGSVCIYYKFNRR
jgi:hypothetical protein